MDIMMNTSNRKYLPKTWQRVADEGVVFNNMAVSMAWCCPSRVSSFTGKLVHNSNVTSSEPPHGGAKKFVDQEMDREYLPVWMQRQGYHTYFTGKFLNQFSSWHVAERCPRGWDVFDAILDGDGCFNEWYYKPIFSNNCNGTWMPNGTYHQTDIIRDKALGWINDAVQRDAPFFIELFPTAPHDQGLGMVAVPCARHQGMYPNETLPRAPNWGARLPDLMGMRNSVTMGFSNSKYVPRLQSLAGIDEMMDAIVTRLEEQGVLNDTYIIFTSDNGFHMGQHSLSYEKFTLYEEDVRVPFFIRGPGATSSHLPTTFSQATDPAARGNWWHSYEKFTLYEEDVRVPFFVRGPGLPKGVMTDFQLTMVDLPSTIMQLAGFDLSDKQWYDTLDGVPIPFAAFNSTIPVSRNSGAPGRAPPPSPPSPPPSPAAPTVLWPIHNKPPPAPVLLRPPPPRPTEAEGKLDAGVGRALKVDAAHHDNAHTSEEEFPSDGALDGGHASSSHASALKHAHTSEEAAGVGALGGEHASSSPASAPKHAHVHRAHSQLDESYYDDESEDDEDVVAAVEAELLRQADVTDASFDIEYYEPSDEEISLHLAQVMHDLGGQVNPLLHYHSGNVSHGRVLVDNTPAGQAPGVSSDLPAVIRDTIIIEGWLDVRMSTYYRKNYKAVRVCAPVYAFGFSKTFMSMTCYKYTIWCIPNNTFNPVDGLILRELYDLGLDPYELNNRYKDIATNVNAARLVNRLDAVMTVMAYCVGPSCRNPWRVLHPDGGVNYLTEAMSSVFDDFYAARRKFTFTMCDVKYLPEENEVADADILRAVAVQNQKASVQSPGPSPPAPAYPLVYPPSSNSSNGSNNSSNGSNGSSNSSNGSDGSSNGSDGSSNGSNGSSNGSNHTVPPPEAGMLPCPWNSTWYFPTPEDGPPSSYTQPFNLSMPLSWGRHKQVLPDGTVRYPYNGQKVIYGPFVSLPTALLMESTIDISGDATVPGTQGAIFFHQEYYYAGGPEFGWVYQCNDGALKQYFCGDCNLATQRWSSSAAKVAFLGRKLSFRLDLSVPLRTMRASIYDPRTPSFKLYDVAQPWPTWLSLDQSAPWFVTLTWQKTQDVNVVASNTNTSVWFRQ
ncbi:hypothetical protein FOA52_012293 [Chlamydomonas sp. UWO 241]|nr:hypothetical protein FOA52_012293 [Chlamydomonas sp. UWO 241]